MMMITKKEKKKERKKERKDTTTKITENPLHPAELSLTVRNRVQ